MEHLTCPNCHNSNPAKIEVISKPVFPWLYDCLICNHCGTVYKIKE